MNRKKLGLLLGAVAIAGCNALIAHSLLSGHAAPSAQALEQERRGPRVAVARHELPAGTILTREMVSFVDWPKDLIGPQNTGSPSLNAGAYVLDNPTSAGSGLARLVGTVVRTDIPEGQPITHGALVAPGDRGFLAATLGAGMPAVTIPVTEHSGVGGFVFPGDRVDLMLTQTVHGGGVGASGSDQSLAVSETILSNLRVLATDQSIGGDTPGGRTVAHVTHAVTLEVTPRNAEKIEVAQTVGTLSLTLRALTDAPAGLVADPAADPDRAISSGTLSIPANASRQDEDRLIAQAARASAENAGDARSSDDGPGFVTGGDVSRFLRRTAPRIVAGGLADGGYARSPSGPLNSGPPNSGATPPAVPVWRGGSVVMVTRGKEVTPVAVGGQ